MSKRDYYVVLEVSRTATGDEIKQAYRGLAMRYHPDRNPGDPTAENAFKEAINFIIRGWNGLEFRVPGFSIGPIGYDGFTLGLPDIPLLADGGIVNSATLAVIGEAGPEAVVPLDRMRGGLPGGPTYNITVQAGVGDPGQIGQSVVEAITAYERRNGAGWRAA